MWDVVELGNNSMKQFWAGESILSLNLRREMPKDDNGRLIRSDQDGSDQQLEVIQPRRVAVDQLTSTRLQLRSAYLGSEASNSRITRSVSSGR